MRFLSMFSGIEAASVAWHPLGWQAAAVCEIDKFASAVLAHHYPDVPNLGDVTEADFDAIGPIDLAVFGSPCQSYSIAGKRLGLDDPRGNLALVGGQVVYRKRPRWFVFENVPGLLSSDSGWDFGTLLAAFAGYPPGSVFQPPEGGWQNSGIVEQAAKDGYGLAWRVLDAQHVRVDGFGRAVPQRRRRVFVVGCLGDWRRAAAVLFERESLSGNPPPRRQAGQGAAPTLAARTRGGGGLGTDFDCDGGLVAHTLSDARGKASAHDHTLETYVPVAHTLNGKGGAGRSDSESESETFLPVAHALRADGFDASEDGTGRGTPLVPVGVALRGRDGGATAEITGPVSSALRTGGGGGDKPHVLAFSSKDSGLDAAENVTPTLRAMGHAESHANAGGQLAVAFRTTGNDGAYESGEVAPCLNTGTDPNHTTLLTGWRVRRLTPTECERLQGFPDSYTAIPYRGKIAADGPRYKALGNSMAVNVMRWIGHRIQMVEEIP